MHDRSGGTECFGAFDLYQEPVVITDLNRRVLFRNAVAARVLRDRCGIAERGGRLVADSPKAEMALGMIVTAFRQAPHRTSPRALRVPRSRNGREWVVLVHPLLDQHGEQPQLRLLIHVIGRKQPRHVPPEILRDLFGLTTREIHVVAALLQARTIKGASLRLSLAQETIRSHVKRIFRKCDVHSKAEFTALLQCISVFR